MKSIVRRDTGEDWNEYLRRLLQGAAGVENPTDEELRRFDRQRKDKRVSNEEWMSSTDPASRIAKMKDGRTHLAYKAEHVVDLETEVVLAAPIYHADEADVDTMVDSVMEAQTNLSEAGIEAEIEEAVADKGYHATDTLELADSLGIRTYIPEPKRKGNGKRNWQGRAGGETSGGPQQSTSYAGCAEQATATSAERTGGTEFRPCVRNGRCPAKLAVRDREGSEAIPDCCGGAQLGLGHAQGVRNGHAARLAGRGRPCLCCVVCLDSHSSPLTSPGRLQITSWSCRHPLRDGRLRRPAAVGNTTISTGC